MMAQPTGRYVTPDQLLPRAAREDGYTLEACYRVRALARCAWFMFFGGLALIAAVESLGAGGGGAIAGLAVVIVGGLGVNRWGGACCWQLPSEAEYAAAVRTETEVINALRAIAASGALDGHVPPATTPDGES